MPERIILDSSPLSLLCHPNEDRPHVREIREWAAAHVVGGSTLLLAEIADYEVRRELIRQGRQKSLRRLDELAEDYEYLPLDTPVIRRAAELWARARQQGHLTAPPEALDGDVILAAQAEIAGATIATENPAHLGWFVPAKSWRDLPPG